MNTLITIVVAIYLVAALLFTLYWFLPESWQDRVSSIFSRCSDAERV